MNIQEDKNVDSNIPQESWSQIGINILVTFGFMIGLSYAMDYWDNIKQILACIALVFLYIFDWMGETVTNPYIIIGIIVTYIIYKLNYISKQLERNKND